MSKKKVKNMPRDQQKAAMANIGKNGTTYHSRQKYQNKEDKVKQRLEHQGISVESKERAYLTNTATLNEKPIEPGTIHYIGASDSPERIYIKEVNEDFIVYTSYPYYKEYKVQRKIGDDLIEQGDSTIYNNGPTFKMESGGKEFHNPKFYELGEKKKLKDIQRVQVKIKTSDSWNEIEQKGFDVSTGNDKDGYTLRMPRREVKELKKHYKITSVTEDRK